MSQKRCPVIICVRCLSVYHTRCLERKTNIKYFSESKTVCYARELMASNEYYVHGLESISSKNKLIDDLRAKSQINNLNVQERVECMLKYSK